MLSVLSILGGIVLIALVGACGGQGQGSSESATGGKLKVVASTTQIGDFVSQVGGDVVDASQILQPNSDPHDYEPRPEDVQAISGANLVFVNGDNLDSWMDNIVSQAGGSPTVVDLSEGVPERLPGESSGAEASKYDPHWWHDPRNAEAAVTEIRDALDKADPDHEDQYDKNADAYVGKIEQLDKSIQACMDQVPEDQRKLVTDHDAFNYFADHYGIKVVGAIIPSQSTEAQPSASETADLILLIKSENVKAIFPESSINPNLAQTIARETGASSGYTLYGDSLGPQGSDADTYLKMEAANADQMVRGFTGGQETCSISTS
jgi:ABC-type Zn uptake system ZnuABC Zn-binding protein ZnuA